MVELILRRIDSHLGHCITNLGFVVSCEKKKCVAHHYEKNGYTSVRIASPIPIYNKYLKPQKHYVHRLVAVYFIENPDPRKYHIIRHIDGDRTNNNVNNLEWLRVEDLKKGYTYDCITESIFYMGDDGCISDKGIERNNILENYINEALERDLTKVKNKNNIWVASFNKKQEENENKIFYNLRTNIILRNIYSNERIDLIDLLYCLEDDQDNRDKVDYH